MSIWSITSRLVVAISICWVGEISLADPGAGQDIPITFATLSVQPQEGIPLKARRLGMGERSGDTEEATSDGTSDGSPSITFTTIHDIKSYGALSGHLRGRVASVEVTWADPQQLGSEKNTDTFLRRLLTHSGGDTFSYIPWAQLLGMPTVATTVQHRQGQDGQWLVWYGWPSVYSAYQDGSGKWWFSVWFEDDGVRTPETSASRP